MRSVTGVSQPASGGFHRRTAQCCCSAVHRNSGLLSGCSGPYAYHAAAGAALMVLLQSSPVYAHIALDQLPDVQQQQQRGQAQSVLAGSTAGFNPSEVGKIRERQLQPSGSRSRSRPRQQSVTATEALDALQQLRGADQLRMQGDYAAALQGYSQLVQQHPDLALTEYARLGQAICLYQQGSTGQALTELNELELDIRGNPETHAALAVVLYAERPAQRWRAEQQWDIALEFDSRYQDMSWVKATKHWPPRLLDALERFLALG